MTTDLWIIAAPDGQLPTKMVSVCRSESSSLFVFSSLCLVSDEDQMGTDFVTTFYPCKCSNLLTLPFCRSASLKTWSRYSRLWPSGHYILPANRMQGLTSSVWAYTQT